MSQPEPLTDQQLDEITARTNAATKGPWGFYDGDTYADVAADMQVTSPGSYSARQMIARLEDENYWDDPAHEDHDEERAAEQMAANAAFIAAAREDVPALLAEVRRLRTALAAAVALHEKGEHNGLAICLHCAQQMFPPPDTGIWSESAHPCATLQALGVGEERRAVDQPARRNP